ncbi:MAG: cytochrome c biogenesis protein ResB [Elusimicrobia bacterium]|nr:cytochrome c biogenesis protein ResB [Elusimicrobiota bacterium]
MRADTPLRRVGRALSSLKLTLACLVLLMVVVAACTLLQVPLGTHQAVVRTVRSFLIWWRPPGLSTRIPVFPGGGLIGAVLLLNLLFAQFLRLELSRRKAGLWMAHLGLALLVLGEFGTALFQVESQMPIPVGQTSSYSQDYDQMELAVVDTTDPKTDVVTAIPQSILKRSKAIETPSLPFTILVKRYYPNSVLSLHRSGDPEPLATAGVGANLNVAPAPLATADNEDNTAAALIEPVAKGRSLGVFWVSNGLGAPQGFALDGRTWRLELRHRRYYLPFSLTLEKFTHDIYPGTDIPKNFASLVRLKDPSAGEDRDVLIHMNHPLRYRGLTFYQASYGKGDKLSIFQVVRNPGWRLPYLACALVALGMLLHFGLKLSASLGRTRA